MKRNLKTLGLALVAAFAMSAVGAAGAQATNFKSDSANGKTSITGGNHEENFDKFNFGFHSECKGTALEGTMVANSQEIITLTAKYGECSSATIRFNHCAYVFNVNTVATPGAGGTHGPLSIECSGGSFIEIDAGGLCTIFIGAQTAIKDGVVYTNVTGASGKKELTTHVTAKEIVIDHNNGGPYCFLTTAKAEYSGRWTLKGFEDTGSPATVGTEGTTPSTVKEGVQVNINKS